MSELSGRNRISRRDFLKRSSLLGAVLGTGGVSTILAACGSNTSSQSVGSSVASQSVGTTPVVQAAKVSGSEPASTATSVQGTTGSTIDPSKKVTLTMWAESYTPSRLLPTTAANRDAPKIKGIGPAVDAYEKLHPNITIKLIPHPYDDQVRRWMITQLTGGTAPDIMWTQPDWAAEDYRKGWWVALDKYFQQPNPYIPDGQPGSKHWINLFEPGIKVWKAANGSLYVVLADQIQLGIYYNKDIFQKAGVSAPPSTWEELMQDAEKIKTAGMYPFAVSAKDLDTLTWVSGWLLNYFYYPEIDELDTDGDRLLTKTEMAKAVKNGKYSFTDKRNKARLEQLKRFASYWQPGAAGIDSDQATRLFVTGRAGMMFSGSWFYKTLQQDPQRKFDFGVFYYPSVGPATSPLIPSDVPPTNKAVGYGSFQYAVTNSAVKNGTVDIAMDFLKFATAPKNLTPMVAEAGTSLPAVKGAGSVPGLEPFRKSLGYPEGAYQSDDSMFDFEFGEKFLAITSPYLTDGQSLDDTAQKLQVAVEQAADRVLSGKSK